MKSKLPKVLHCLAGRPLVRYVIELASEVGSERIILVVGRGRELVIETTKDWGVQYAIQEHQLGTANAVASCVEFLKDYNGHVLLLSGDVPLISAETIREAFSLHVRSRASVTVFTFKPPVVKGYGRIIRGENGELLKIVEAKDATRRELVIREVNGGVYFFNCRDLVQALPEIGNDNAAGEYYITDAVGIIRRRRLGAAAYLVEDPVELGGVNDPKQLRELEEELIRRRGW